MVLKHHCQDKFRSLLSKLVQEEELSTITNDYENAIDEDDQLPELEYLSLEAADYTPEVMEQRLHYYHPYIQNEIDNLLTKVHVTTIR